jgi:alpha/beta superfamily hydrolase
MHSGRWHPILMRERHVTPHDSGTNGTAFVPARGPESAGYLDGPGGQLYFVFHSAVGPRRGALLLCGCFGAERERSYFTLARWCRLLAGSGFDVMRFDYRGMGESPGRFEEATISRWRDDAAFCAAHLRRVSAGVPLVLHGVRIGALIAAELFKAGVGDAMLLWAPPPSAHAHLWEIMRRTLVSEMLRDPASPPPTREEQFRAIRNGASVNVDGYFWSRDFCEDADSHTLATPAPDEPRPWTIVDIHRSERSAAAGVAHGHREKVSGDAFWELSRRLEMRVDRVVGTSMEWLDRCCPACGGMGE